jgi:hypothetical protein
LINDPLLLIYFTFLGKPLKKKDVTFVLISFLFFITIIEIKGASRNVLPPARKKQQTIAQKFTFLGAENFFHSESTVSTTAFSLF